MRFLTCGSVDDGKSTLIGRLISDAAGLHDDQIASLRDNSRRFGTTEDEFDFALLLDGLEAEREQGITIDVAYRFFSTARRAFVVADTPGHQQYTRNMATGASNAELAILLVDARKGLVEQTRRHAAIVSLLGIRHVVLAVNKIDLVEFSEARFREIEAAFAAFAAPLAFHSVVAIPLSARLGDNVAVRSERTPWYAGPALLAHLETVETDLDAAEAPLRFPVQWVNRPDGEFRGFSGTVASGRVAVGDPIVVSGSGRTSSVARIVSFDGDLSSAAAGRSVTLTLADEVDVIRGDVLADPRHRPAVARRFAADLVWMDETAATPGKRFLLKIGTATVPATLSRIADTLDVESLTRAPAASLVLNAIGRVEIEAAQAVAFDAYAENRQTGAFILIDRSTLRTAAAGMVVESADTGRHVHRHAETVTPALRAEAKGAAAVGRVADRPAGLGQVDHRQHRREQACRARPPDHAARRRQPAAGPERRSRLRCCRPLGECPPGGRGRQADDRRRPDRHCRPGLALPGRPQARRGTPARRTLSGNLRRYAHRDLPAPRSQGAVREGRSRQGAEPHRARPAL